MDGKKADMVFTDPPYGVDIGDKLGRDIMGDGSIAEMGAIVKDAFVNLSMVIKDGAAYYICSPQGGDMELMMMMMRDAGIKCRHQIIWKKDAAVFSMGRLDYDYIHEPILYGWKKAHQFYSNNETSVWEIPRPKSSKLHPTMKPIALVVKALKNSSKEEDLIVDLFGGSGSTLIACEQTNRICYMMELDPKYCDVIRKRYYKFIGKEEEWNPINK
jgi:DNA modification methylase